MANTQNASFQMLVLPDRHHFYTALAFHISSYIFHISSILDTRQTSLPLLFFSCLFIYLFLPFSSSSSSCSSFLFLLPFLRFSLFILSYHLQAWRKVFLSFFLFFFFFFFKFIPHLYIFIRSRKLMFPLNMSSLLFLSLSLAANY